MEGPSRPQWSRNEPVQATGEERPLGLKIFVGYYAVVLTILLLFLPAIGLGLVVWLVVPIPLTALYVTYHLWKLKFWAWVVTIALHLIGFMLSVTLFAVGRQTPAEFGIDLAFVAVFVGYLYAIRDRFD